MPFAALKNSCQTGLVIQRVVDEAIGNAIHRTQYHVSDAKGGIAE
jgi:hypothetical protein